MRTDRILFDCRSAAVAALSVGARLQRLSVQRRHLSGTWKGGCLMGAKTGIEWTDATWSPIRARVKKGAAKIARAKGYTSLVQIAEKMAGHVGPHCEHKSSGCDHCYAETNNHRCLPHNGTGLPYDRRSRDLVDPVIDEKVLSQPLSWRKPKLIFIENQSDLFGEWVTDGMLDRVFDVMARCPQHVFQLLTKRPERMLEYLQDRAPLANVWLGVSVENQAVDKRIPLLLQTPTAVRFLSCEPLLGPITLEGCERLDWVICGGGSGPHARPMHPDWAHSLRDQCIAAGVPFFFKQWGAYNSQAVRMGKKAAGAMLDGREWKEFPVVSKKTMSKKPA
jgi:protein gp37